MVIRPHAQGKLAFADGSVRFAQSRPRVGLELAVCCPLIGALHDKAQAPYLTLQRLRLDIREAHLPGELNHSSRYGVVQPIPVTLPV